MNANSTSKTSLAAYAVAVLGAFLIMYALVRFMRHYTTPAPVGQVRVLERKKNLAELRAENAKLVNGLDWQDQAKGFVRLPVTNAMELIVKEYQNPAAARSNLIARAEKANAAPPKAPEKPNQYE